MPLFDIHHVAIKCKDGKLKESEDFYTKVLGMGSADRPELGFPGAWLDMDGTMFHLMELEFPADVDPWYARKEAGSALDHIAIKARNFDAFKKQVIALGVDWRQNIISGAGLWQLFRARPQRHHRRAQLRHRRRARRQHGPRRRHALPANGGMIGDKLRQVRPWLPVEVGNSVTILDHRPVVRSLVGQFPAHL